MYNSPVRPANAEKNRLETVERGLSKLLGNYLFSSFITMLTILGNGLWAEAVGDPNIEETYEGLTITSISIISESRNNTNVNKYKKSVTKRAATLVLIRQRNSMPASDDIIDLGAGI